LHRAKLALKSLRLFDQTGPLLPEPFDLGAESFPLIVKRGVLLLQFAAFALKRGDRPTRLGQFEPEHVDRLAERRARLAELESLLLVRHSQSIFRWLELVALAIPVFAVAAWRVCSSRVHFYQPRIIAKLGLLSLA
jgi:hypothetical protein